MMQWRFREGEQLPMSHDLCEADLGFDDRFFSIHCSELLYSTPLLHIFTLMGLIETRKTHFKVAGNFFLTKKEKSQKC